MTTGQLASASAASPQPKFLTVNLDRSLMLIECALVFVLIYCHTAALHLIERVAEPPNPIASVALLFAALACFLCHRKSLSRRSTLALVLLETILVTAAAVFGLPRLFPVMYVVIVARTGLLVRGRELLAVVLLCVLIFIIGKEARYLLTERAVFSLSFVQHVFHLVVVGRLLNFVIAVSFSALCVSAIKGERQSRLERETLNLEVEKMSTALERTRIAREIHDNAGHTLTSLNMQLELAQKLLERKPERITEVLLKVRDMAQRARLDLESSLKAPEAENVGLRSKLESLVVDCNQLNPFITRLFFNAPDPSERIQHEVYCIVKEALNNVKKYANATAATVTVAHFDNHLLVDIEDNGAGFDTSKKMDNKYGLRGMAERADLIRGSLKVESEVGSGTKVQLSVAIEVPVPSGLTGNGGAIVSSSNDGEAHVQRAGDKLGWPGGEKSEPKPCDLEGEEERLDVSEADGH